ncbi:MAG: LysR family transcriptional regulator, partial [Ruthenibacterium lactatiformans]
MAHSACREDEQAGRLAVVPLEKPGMVRRINMVHH